MSVHFHIQWPDSIDWERHVTRSDAEASAKDLVRQGETYSIGEFADNDCPTCLGLRHFKSVTRCTCARHGGQCRRLSNGRDGFCESCRDKHKTRRVVYFGS